MAGRVNIRIDESMLILAPGEPAGVEVWITNAGGVVDAFNLTVAGLDRSWYSLTGDAVSLFPNQSNGVTLVVQPPSTSGALAGNYPFTVIVTSVDDPTESASASIVLQLKAVEDLALELSPQRVAGRKGLFNIELVNPGNRPYPLVLSLTDPDETLRYTLGAPEIHNREWSKREAGMPTKDVEARSEVVLGKPEATGDGSLEHEIEVPPGGSVLVPLMVTPRKRIWTGKEKLFNFEVRTHPPGVEWDVHQARSTRGELAYRPILAMWYGMPAALRRALPILLGLVFLGVLLYLLFKPPDTPIGPVIDAQATQTALVEANANANASANATQTALAAAALNSAAATQTALAFANQQNGNGDTDANGAVGPSADGVPDIRKFWLEIPTIEPVTNQEEPNLQFDITSAQSVVITPTTRFSNLQGWETSLIIDYELTAIGEKGTATNTISVLIVRPPSIGIFSAEPMTITQGESSTLLWTVLAAKSTTLDGVPIDPGQLAADGQSRTGSISVSPPETKDYTFCASNDAGQTCQTQRVWVVLPATAVPPTETHTSTAVPPTPTFTFTPVPTGTPPPTNTPAPTATPAPPTNTPLVPPTNTPIPTATPVPPSSTSVPTFTPTFTHTPTFTPTSTPTLTFTPTETYTPTPTETYTPEPMATACATWEPHDVPKRLYGRSIINVTSHGIISDVNILDLHWYSVPIQERFNVYLQSPDGFRPGVTQQVSTYRCNDDDAPYEVQIDLDDQAEAFNDPCNPDRAYGTFKPDNPLSVFNGLDAFGDWVLTINDPSLMGEPGDDPSIAGDIEPLQFAPSPTPTRRGIPPSPTWTPRPQQPSSLIHWVLEICFTNGQRAYYTLDGR